MELYDYKRLFKYYIFTYIKHENDAYKSHVTSPNLHVTKKHFIIRGLDIVYHLRNKQLLFLF